MGKISPFIAVFLGTVLVTFLLATVVVHQFNQTEPQKTVAVVDVGYVRMDNNEILDPHLNDCGREKHISDPNFVCAGRTYKLSSKGDENWDGQNYILRIKGDYSYSVLDDGSLGIKSAHYSKRNFIIEDINWVSTIDGNSVAFIRGADKNCQRNFFHDCIGENPCLDANFMIKWNYYGNIYCAGPMFDSNDLTHSMASGH